VGDRAGRTDITRPGSRRGVGSTGARWDTAGRAAARSGPGPTGGAAPCRGVASSSLFPFFLYLCGSCPLLVPVQHQNAASADRVPGSAAPVDPLGSRPAGVAATGRPTPASAQGLADRRAGPCPPLDPRTRPPTGGPVAGAAPRPSVSPDRPGPTQPPSPRAPASSSRAQPSRSTGAADSAPLEAGPGLGGSGRVPCADGRDGDAALSA